jgi:hypothetical protein
LNEGLRVGNEGVEQVEAFEFSVILLSRVFLCVL